MPLSKILRVPVLTFEADNDFHIRGVAAALMSATSQLKLIIMLLDCKDLTHLLNWRLVRSTGSFASAQMNNVANSYSRERVLAMI